MYGATSKLGSVKVGSMFAALGIAATMALAARSTGVAATQVQFTTAEGVKIYGTAYPASGKPSATILLFHQAGSSKSEYLPIAPRLSALDYNVLAIDQRCGGDLYLPPNETVRHLGRRKSAPCTSVLADMDATVAYAIRPASSSHSPLSIAISPRLSRSHRAPPPYPWSVTSRPCLVRKMQYEPPMSFPSLQVIALANYDECVSRRKPASLAS